MRLPEIPYSVGKTKRELVAMGGLNWSDRRKDGDLADSRSLSFRRWPYLSARKGRKELAGHDDCTALGAWDKLLSVEGTSLLYDGKVVGTVTAGEKQFAVVNTKLVIWPDRVYLDLEDQSLVSLGGSMTLAAGTATFSGNTLEAPESVLTATGELGCRFLQNDGYSWFSELRLLKLTRIRWSEKRGWSDASYEEIMMKDVKAGDRLMLQCGREKDLWVVYRDDDDEDYQTFNDAGRFGVVTGVDIVMGIDESHINLTGDIYRYAGNDPFTDHFKDGDAVTISGAGANDRESAVIQTVEERRLVFTAEFSELTNTTGQVSLSRGIPAMDYICEAENRIWGCSNTTGTIYASALGDPTNFNTFAGLSTDSYAVAVGGEGAFTGCCKLGSAVLFWKERRLHKVLGSYPAEYALYSYDVEGVREGCHRSLQVINEALYYVGQRGVFCYTGSMPQLISECFGARRLSNGVSGTDGERYYLSAKDETGEWLLLVYDPALGLWLKEDELECRDFARVGRALYLADGTGRVWQVDGEEDISAQEWLAQLAPVYETIEGKKRYSRLLLRVELPAGGWLRVETRHDGGIWRECGRVVGRGQGVATLRVPINRCDKFELRLSGKGDCAVLSMMKEYTVGSER